MADAGSPLLQFCSCLCVQLDFLKELIFRIDHKYFSLKILATAPPSDTENPGPAKQHFLSREPLGLSSEAFFCLDSVRIFFFYFNLEIQKWCQKMYGQSLSLYFVPNMNLSIHTGLFLCSGKCSSITFWQLFCYVCFVISRASHTVWLKPPHHIWPLSAPAHRRLLCIPRGFASVFSTALLLVSMISVLFLWLFIQILTKP